MTRPEQGEETPAMRVAYADKGAAERARVHAFPIAIYFDLGGELDSEPEWFAAFERLGDCYLVSPGAIAAVIAQAIICGIDDGTVLSLKDSAASAGNQFLQLDPDRQAALLPMVEGIRRNLDENWPLSEKDPYRGMNARMTVQDECGSI